MLAEYTHCRNHILNLAIIYACKNQSIKKVMDNLTASFLTAICKVKVFEGRLGPRLCVHPNLRFF